MSDGRGRLAPALAELILPIAAIAFTSYYIWSVRDGPWEAKFSAYLVGSSLIVVCVLFLAIRGWALLRHRLPEIKSHTARAVTVRRVILLVLTFGYILLIDHGGGFTLSNFLFLTAAILVLSGGARPRTAITVAATLSLCGYLLFIVAFDTRFPEGPFERAMDHVWASMAKGDG